LTKSDLRLPYPPIPNRLQQIDALTLGEHWHIGVDDECFFLWERVTGAKYDQYPTNQLIKNIKIPASYRDQPRWFYKVQAINYAASALSQLLPEPWRDATFVPIPPSLTKGHPDHDPRMLDLLRTVRPRLPDIRELVLLNTDTVANEKNISPEARAENYEINDQCECPDPTDVIIVDDMLAGGSHFKGMKIVLSGRFPQARLYGLFLSRAIRPNPVPILDGLI
jgi:hypothetical protein